VWDNTGRISQSKIASAQDTVTAVTRADLPAVLLGLLREQLRYHDVPLLIQAAVWLSQIGV